MFHSACDIWMSVDGQVWAEMGKRASEIMSIAWSDPMDTKKKAEKQSQTMTLVPLTILSLNLGVKTLEG